MSALADGPASASPRPGGWLRIALALLALNGVLAMNQWWPTPFPVPDHRLAPEAVLVWCLLLAFAALGRTPGPRALAVGAALLTVLAVGRYLDVVVPGLFGRPVNLYWDVRHLPRFLAVSADHRPSAAALAALVAVAFGLWVLYRGLRAALRVAALEAAPRALRSPAALAASALALALVLANYAGIRATWPVVARPIAPTYVEQVRLIATALLPGRLEAALPPSPAFDGGVAGLLGADLTVIFLESYGAVTFDDRGMHARLAEGRAALGRGIAASGRSVVSAFVRSPTIGGASDLAHLGLLAGLDLQDPHRHDLLLASDRPTLLSFFRRHGYEVHGLYPALSWAWPERAFYGFDVFHDGPSLGWRGPELGYWKIPDQFSIARHAQLHPVRAGGPPRLLFFPTITSHVPFRPVPVYQPDWDRILGERPYDDPDLDRMHADAVDWLDLGPAFERMIGYTYAWLGAWVARPRERPETLVVLGDHQPSAAVTGPGVRWDVPVHVISADPTLLARLRAVGFVDGLEPAPGSLGPIHQLTRWLLDAFDGESKLARR